MNDIDLPLHEATPDDFSGQALFGPADFEIPLYAIADHPVRPAINIGPKL